MSKAPEGTTFVRTRSHRARDRMKLVAGECEAFFNFYGDTGIYAVPDEHLSEVLTIKGITKARPKADLMRCWS